MAAVRNVATRTGPVTQTRQSTGLANDLLAAGTSAFGPWRLARFAIRSESGEPTGGQTLYGIASHRVGHRRYSQLRIFADVPEARTPQQVASPAIAGALEALLSRARAELRIVPVAR